MTNSTFNAIVSTPITYKKKGADGKYIAMTTTALADNFAHAPKAKDCTDGEATSALSNLDKVYDYMTEMSTSRTDNQRNKAFNKVCDFAKAYLKAVGLSDSMANVFSICSCFAAKRQTKTDRNTKEKTVLAGYTTKSTFIKYVLFVTNHVIETGAWCDPKTSKKASKSEMDELMEQINRNKAEYEAEKAKNKANEDSITFLMGILTPDQLAALNARQTK
mgnify:CR=1 FL=1